MTTPHHDSDLRDRFLALKRDDAARAAPFAPPARHSDRRRTIPAWAAVMLTAAAAGLVWTLTRGTPTPRPDALDLTAVSWPAPSDFLLETPGRELLRDLPPLGLPYDAATAGPTAGPSPTIREGRNES